MSPNPTAPRWRSTRASGGFSLLETLIALVLMSLLLVGVAQGLFVTVKTSGDNRTSTVASVRLDSVIERMRALATGPGFYKACATAEQIRAAVLADPGHSLDGATLDVTGVSYWDGSNYAPSCPADRGAQLVTVRVSVGPAPDPSVATGIVVLRNPSAPTAAVGP